MFIPTWWLSGKESACQCRRHSRFDPSPWEGNGNPLQYSSLRNSMDRGAWWARVHRVTKEPNMTEHLSRAEQKIRNALADPVVEFQSRDRGRRGKEG